MPDDEGGGEYLALDSFEDAEKWARKNTAAGYIQPSIGLTAKDVENLANGKVLVTDGEYGVEIYLDKFMDKLLRRKRVP